MAAMVYVDIVSHRVVLRFPTADPRYSPILKGMLIRAPIKMKTNKYVMSGKEFPDLVFAFGLEEFDPYNEANLKTYLKEYASKMAEHLLKDSAEYVKGEGIEKVFRFLVPVLESEKLKFYKPIRCEPHGGESPIMFGDFSKPEPVLLYLAFGMRAYFRPNALSDINIPVPWKPDQNRMWSSEETFVPPSCSTCMYQTSSSCSCSCSSACTD